MISSYGPAARRHELALGDINAIITEPTSIVSATIEAIRRRERGEAFYGMLLLDEPRTRAVESVGSSLLLVESDPDRRLLYLDQLGDGKLVVNGQPASAMFEPGFDSSLKQTATEFFTLSSAVLVRSFTEYARIFPYLQRPRSVERFVAVPEVPRAERSLLPESPSVVVWATHLPSNLAAVYAFALADFQGEVTFVTGPGTTPAGFPGTFLHPDDPEVPAALARASTVIATDAADPGCAVAFAMRGYGVAAPVTSGAHEYVRDIISYDPGFPRSIYIAVVTSMGQPAALREACPPVPPSLSIGVLGRSDRSALPAVTVIVPTFNRRVDIERCLQCIAAQTYPNVKAIIVNDAGESVDDIVAKFPFATALNLKVNGGATRAQNEGIKAADTPLIQLLADDDWLYPDHLERAVSVMLVSGASIVHSNCLIRHQQRNAQGIVETVGFNALVHIDTSTPAESLIATAIVGITILWRREVFEQAGLWREDWLLADYELQARTMQSFAYAYVDHMTAEWRLRGESYFKDMDSAGVLRRMFDELFPRPGRPVLEERRANAIANVARRPAGQFMFPPTIRVTPPSSPAP